MRLLKYVARKSLLALGYPKLEHLHPELGIYEVGAIKARMAPDVPACQFFYPVDPGSKQKRGGKQDKVPYYRKEAVDGLVEYLNGFGDGLLQMLQEKAHPNGDFYGADPLESDDDDDDDDAKFPLVLFSHGLSGSMEMYTELCSQIASTGCVVVALEHEDGSASYASKGGTFTITGRTNSDNDNHSDRDSDSRKDVVPFKKPPANPNRIPFTRKRVTDFRMPMLEQRVGELQRVYEAFVVHDGDNNNFDDDDDDDGRSAGFGVGDDPQAAAVSELLRKIVASTDPSHLHLVGHSFGGATQLLAAQAWTNATNPSTSTNMKTNEPALEMAMSSAVVSGVSATATATATATITATQQLLSLPERPSRQNPPIPIIPRSITLFDAWNYVLSDDVLKRGLRLEVEAPPDSSSSSNSNSNSNVNDLPPKLEVLSVVSANWTHPDPEEDKILEFLRNCDPATTNVRSCHAKHSVHQSCSDAEAYLPGWVAPRLGNRGKGEPRHQTIRALVEEIAAFANANKDKVKGKGKATRKAEFDSEIDSEIDSVLVPFPLR